MKDEFHIMLCFRKCHLSQRPLLRNKGLSLSWCGETNLLSNFNTTMKGMKTDTNTADKGFTKQTILTRRLLHNNFFLKVGRLGNQLDYGGTQFGNGTFHSLDPPPGKRI